MTRPQHPGDPAERRSRIALAVITGLLSGATRAIAGWLLDKLTSAVNRYILRYRRISDPLRVGRVIQPGVQLCSRAVERWA